MNILFLHRSFPAQFKYIAIELAKDKSNTVTFITESDEFEIEGINKIVYTVEEVAPEANPLTKSFARSILHAKSTAQKAQELKASGYVPDVIYAHSGWGVGMFIKEVFPDTPLVCYFEWFRNVEGADIGFLGEELTDYQKEGVRCSNAQVLMDLVNCDGGISPSQWQKSQFPKEFQDKITVIPDGVEAEFYKPDGDAKFLNFSSNDEIITYATRGMEPYRGFPQFMKAVEKLLKQRPNAHFVIAGNDKSYYSGRLENQTYKQKALDELDIDLNRVHFVGGLSYEDYKRLLQVSSVHVYLTVPYVLSWSLLDSMSCGCSIVASDTQPVCEVIKDNYNGLLVDFFDTEKLVEKIEYLLDNFQKAKTLRENARKTILDKYALKDVLPKHIEYFKCFSERKRS